MKIAVIAHLKYPIGQPFAGGLERHTHTLVRGLRRRGHEIVLFAAQGSEEALGSVCFCAPTGELTGHRGQDLKLEAEEFSVYARIMETIASDKFDVVHNNALHELPLRLSSSLATPMVTVLHTPPFESLVRGVQAGLAAGRFIAVSRTLAVQWSSIVQRLTVVGNGIELDKFPYRSRPDERDYALWSGRIVPEKGLHLAIDACRVAGLPLVFAGPRSNLDYWQEMIAPRLGADVFDLGHLDQRELAAWLGGARVAVVSPRWEEPFGLVVPEALACGTPVAAFRRGALSEILDDDSGCLAVPDDIKDLARSILDASRLQRSLCRKRAEAVFDAETMIDGYEAEYARMLENRDTLGVQHTSEIAPVALAAR